MENGISFRARVQLKERLYQPKNYGYKKRKEYYLVLDAIVIDEKQPIAWLYVKPSTKANIEIPITENQYKNINKSISKSKTKKCVLKLNGKLELMV